VIRNFQENMSKVDLKVVLLGKEFSGKTSLVERFLNERFIGENKYQNTIGAAYGARELIVEGGRRSGVKVVLGIWDTAGSERYESMSRLYYRGAGAAVICYSVNDSDSWSRLEFWVSELRKMEEECRLYICATKLDLIGGNNKARSVDYHDTIDYCDEVGAQLFETSSKSGKGILELFTKVATDYVESRKETEEIFRTELKEKSEKKSCCGRK